VQTRSVLRRLKTTLSDPEKMKAWFHPVVKP
jgi:hypothetical protein